MSTLIGADALNRRLNVLASPAVSRQMLSRIGQDTLGLAKQNFRPHSRTTGSGTSATGRLQVQDRSFRVSFGRAAILIEKGTRPHRIEARRAKALKFVGKAGRASGQVRLSGTARRGATDIVFVPGPGYARGRQKDHVDHPGTKADPFLEPAARKALHLNGITDVVVKAWNDAA